MALPYRPCAGILLLNSNDQIFVGERLDRPGAWQMPQGGIDEGESPEVAALRELEEEIGVRADQVQLLAQTQDWVLYDLPDHLKGKMWGGKFAGQKQLWFKLRLLADDEAIDIETSHPEFGRWKWSDPSTVIEEIVDFKRDVYQRVIDELMT
ncbi:MAG: RNA pyrophosphohydrolase [Kordiimonadaceae bacterium]|nr:RNA pyrophosphohydrolase [Kordiimonadaceae bacterium]MBO6567608.1 RNA pyrophosphohydrolase [Kordiimonadaceae bacterium]MBO6963178.1 RNA pyrophosphohydrolase [Kordiimonadaceae bacterium]